MAWLMVSQLPQSRSWNFLTFNHGPDARPAPLLSAEDEFDNNILSFSKTN